jgi:DNA-binding protein HU-beta
MNKTDLVERICADADLNKTKSKKAIAIMMRCVTNAVKRGDHVTLSGFGVFSVYDRKAQNWTKSSDRLGHQIKKAAASPSSPPE